MRAAVLFFTLVLACICAGQANTVERFLIDDFSVNQNQVVEIKLTRDVSAADPDIIESSTYVGDGSVPNCNSRLLGCARDMRMQVRVGGIGRTFTTNIFPTNAAERAQGFEGEWVVSNPKGGSSINFLQYDGGDGSANLNNRGLGGLDFTQGGLATGLRFFIVSDLPSDFTVTLFDLNGGKSSAVVSFNVLNQNEDNLRDRIAEDILYSRFSGNVDLTSIGAVELEIPSIDAVDAFVREIAVLGRPDPSATRTPAPSATRTPQPSASRTPAPSPSITPSPSGPCVTRCVCPSFTCALIFDNVNSLNDVDRNLRQDQIIFDDSDIAVPIPVPVPVPAVSTFSVPTVPTVSIPTVSFPTVSTVSLPTFSTISNTLPSFTFGTGSGSSDAFTLVASVGFVIAAAFI